MYSVVSLFLINHHCGLGAWEILTDRYRADAHGQMGICTLGRSFSKTVSPSGKLTLFCAVLTPRRAFWVDTKATKSDVTAPRSVQSSGTEFTAGTVVLGETFKEVGAAGVAGWSCRRGWGGGGVGLQAWLG